MTEIILDIHFSLAFINLVVSNSGASAFYHTRVSNWGGRGEGQYYGIHAPPDFHFKLVSAHKSALSCQVREAVRIRRRGRAGQIFNSKSEKEDKEVKSQRVSSQLQKREAMTRSIDGNNDEQLERRKHRERVIQDTEDFIQMQGLLWYIFCSWEIFVFETFFLSFW